MLECIKGKKHCLNKWNIIWRIFLLFARYFILTRTRTHSSTRSNALVIITLCASAGERRHAECTNTKWQCQCQCDSVLVWLTLRLNTQRERERASRMNTQFPFYRNCLFRANNHSSVDQRFSKSVSYTDTSSTVLYFYPLSSTETLSGYLCQSTAHDDDNDDDINDTFYRYFNHARSTNKQQQQHFHTTIKFIKYSWFRYCYTVCDRIITVPVFRFFIFSFVIVYCLSRYFTPFVCVCAVADWQFLCTHTRTLHPAKVMIWIS